MKHKLAQRVDKIKPSFTLQMATIAAEMKSKGIDVINLSVGEPDFNTPVNIINAGKTAMDEGYTKYTAGPGMIEFRDAICEKLKRENGIDYDRSNILVSNGEKQSLSTVCQALFEEGDEVVVFRPYWVSFPEFVRLANAEPIIVNTLEEQNYEPDFDDLKIKTSEKIKGVIINSPSNPTGGVWSEEAIKNILNIAKKNNWVLISDECYEKIVYDRDFISIEKINRDNNINATVITCMSLSKTYAMTGWRIGYASGPIDIIKAMSKIQGQATSCANSIGQKAGIEALLGNQEHTNKMILEYKKRRDLIVALLNHLSGVTCVTPKGAFYAFPDFSHYLNKYVDGKLLKDTFAISEYILEYAKVVTVPGDGFGSPKHLRFSYATNKKTIKEGIKRIEKALKRII
ncbi:MAG: aspartate aminotransferase [Candidatus Marinimicrobia bacterium]|nr:aspartate aminotransferase [Candidatus Neomarinimicrobiota bacterium]